MQAVGRDDQEYAGALPFSDVSGLLSASAAAEKQQALVANIYPLLASNGTTDDDVIAQLVHLKVQLEKLIASPISKAGQSEQTYIWHKEPPLISLLHCSTSNLPRKNEAQTDHKLTLRLRTGGECIEDEWMVVYLMLEATKRFADLQLVVSVENEDGQFLLIEAAAQLPAWITPETAANRVWLYNGQLHLITPHLLPQGDQTIPEHEAVDVVRSPSLKTRAPEEMEQAALSRAHEYPQAAHDNAHTTLAYLPRKVARLLILEPQLVSTCVAAIQSRDVMSSRASARMTHFPPSLPGAENSASNDAVILTPARMTRHLYAQLSYDRFFPPRQLGRSWQMAVESHRLKLHQNPDYATDRSAEANEGRWRDIGAKIWCGLEMAYDESLSKSRRIDTKNARAHGSMTAKQHEAFVAALKKLGYFGNEIEGSARWQELESAAMQEMASNPLEGSDRSGVGFANIVDKLRKQQIEGGKLPLVLQAQIVSLDLPTHEDSDEWLYLTEQDLEEITASKPDIKGSNSNGASEEDAFNRLNAFTSKMQEFMTTRSDVQGALFEDEVDADEDMSEDDLLFEDLNDEEQERRVQQQAKKRVSQTTAEERLAFLQTLIPRMTAEEWNSGPKAAVERTRSPLAPSNIAETEKGSGFLSSLDAFAAENAKDKMRDELMPSTVAKLPQLKRAEEELQRRLASQYMRETSAKMSKELYEGASDSDSDELEEEQSPEVRRQLAEEYDLVLDDEVDDAGDAVDMQDLPDLDNQAEMENLLDFARTSLGLSKEQYEQILQERAQQGKFVPAFAEATETEPSTGKVDIATKESVPTKAIPASLDTFEAVMQEMDSRLAELQRNKANERSDPDAQRSGGPSVNEALGAEEEELFAHLLKSGGDLPSSLWSALSQGNSSDKAIQVQQASDFLKSFQAQAFTTGPGSSTGPVEALMRRFGLGSLPADADSRSGA